MYMCMYIFMVNICKYVFFMCVFYDGICTCCSVFVFINDMNTNFDSC